MKCQPSHQQCWTSYSERVISYVLLITPYRNKTFTLFITKAVKRLIYKKKLQLITEFQ